MKWDGGVKSIRMSNLIGPVISFIGKIISILTSLVKKLFLGVDVEFDTPVINWEKKMYNFHTPAAQSEATVFDLTVKLYLTNKSPDNKIVKSLNLLVYSGDKETLNKPVNDKDDIANKHSGVTNYEQMAPFTIPANDVVTKTVNIKVHFEDIPFDRLLLNFKINKKPKNILIKKFN